jgi:hypothetical protein
MVTREICKVCYHINTVGFSVPDEIWQVTVPEKLQNSVLCLACFIRFADEQLIEWDKDIKFYPVSFATYLRLL